MTTDRLVSSPLPSSHRHSLPPPHIASTASAASPVGAATPAIRLGGSLSGGSTQCLVAGVQHLLASTKTNHNNLIYLFSTHTHTLTQPSMSLWWGSDPFAELVAKATSELLPAGQEDIALNLEICDQVRAKQVPPKQAMQTIKKRISDSNPNVVLLALGLTDICIKNGGDHFLAEVASREFMDNLASVLRKPAGVNHDVKAKALRLIQSWAQIAEAKPSQMEYINVVYRSLKVDGFGFPPLDPAVASAAFVETLTAPEWVDGDVCMRCRSAFSTFNRKHHCRNCGNVFCQQCSSHNMSLPWYGVGQDVRVCDGCHAKKAPPKFVASSSSAAAKKLQRSSTGLYAPSGRGGVGSTQRAATLSGKTGPSSRRSKREEDDLALAIKLSLQDSSTSTIQNLTPSEPSAHRATRQSNGRMLEGTDADDDPDLAAAIAASLREYAPPTPSAPLGGDETITSTSSSQTASHDFAVRSPALLLPPSLDLPPKDIDAILTFTQTMRAQDHQARQHGASEAPSHPSQALYGQATAARPKIARSLDEARRREGVLLSMHDKLTEAVKLYDRLLDAQMSGPAASLVPGYAAQLYQPQQHYQAPGSPDPYPRQHYASHPHYFQQQQQQQPEQVYNHIYAQQQAPGTSPNSSMYPSLPPFSLATMQADSHAGPSYHMHPQGYDQIGAYVAPIQPGLEMAPSSSQQSTSAGKQLPYVGSVAQTANGYQQTSQPQQQQYYGDHLIQSPQADYHDATPAPNPQSVARQPQERTNPRGCGSQQTPVRGSVVQPRQVSAPNGVTSLASQTPAPLDHFEKLMSPGQGQGQRYPAHASDPVLNGYVENTSSATCHADSRAGAGAHGKTAAATSGPESWTNNGSISGRVLLASPSPALTVEAAATAPAPASCFPDVPAGHFTDSIPSVLPSQPTADLACASKQQQYQPAEAPALIEL